MANFYDPAEKCVNGSNIINEVAYEDSTLGIINYFCDKEGDPEKLAIRGRVIGNLVLRFGEFQVLMVKTDEEKPKIAFLYLNKNQNCFKPWAESKREVWEALRDENASPAIKKEVFEKLKGEKVATYRQLHKIARTIA